MLVSEERGTPSQQSDCLAHPTKRVHAVTKLLWLRLHDMLTSEPGVDLQGLPAGGGPVLLASKTLQDRRALADVSAMSHISLTLAISVIIDEPRLVRPCETPAAFSGAAEVVRVLTLLF